MKQIHIYVINYPNLEIYYSLFYFKKISFQANRKFSIYFFFNQMSWFCRVVLFSHIFPLKQYFINKKAANQTIVTKPPLNIFQNNNQFVDVLDKFQKLLQQNAQQLTEITIFSIVIQCFKYQFIGLFFGCFFQSFFRLLNSVIVLFLIQSIIQNTINKSYILAAILICSMLLVSIIQNNWYLKGKYVYTSIQSVITMVCYRSISKLKQSTVNKHQIGKIINLISCDFNHSQITFIEIFFFLVCPFIILGCAGVLVYSLGWFGLISMVISILNIFLQILISKKTSTVLEQLNGYKDERIEHTQQIIGGIRYAKLYNYETQYGRKIKQFRQKQSACYLKNWFYEALQRALVLSASHIGLFITFMIIYYVDRSRLNLKTIFSSLSVISFFRMFLWCVQVGIRNIFEIKIIFKRFLQIYKIKQDNQEVSIQYFQHNCNSKQEYNPQEKELQGNNNDLQVGQIKFTDYTAKWINDGFQLRNINLNIKPGKIYGIGGVIGSGKSTILSAILKQISIISHGSCQYKGSLAYVQQQPCLFTGTIKQNILFGREWNEKLYIEVLERSCLLQDLKILAGGDLSKVGQKGVTLSGGQKSRISLARALYSQADIYLLDDPLSGLDTKTNKYIFENVLKGNMLKGKTIILVSHLINYLQKCDTILIMTNGQISNKPDSLQMLSTEIHKIQANLNTHDKNHQTLPISNHQKTNNNNQQSQVSFSTLIKFITYPRRFIFLSIALAIYIISQTVMAFYLRLLSMYNKINSPLFSNYNIFWIVLAALIICYLILIISRIYMISQLLLSCIDKIHNNMLEGIIRSPLKFYDITSSSILINKFSNDINIMDTSFIIFFILLIEGIFLIIVAFINIAQIVPFFLLPCALSIVLIIVWFIYWKNAVIYSQEQVLQSKTPLYQEIFFLTQNLTQIHIYQQEQNTQKRMMNRMERFIVQKNSSISLISIFRLYLSYFAILTTSVTILLGLRIVQNPGSYAMCIVILIEIQDLIDYYGSLFIDLQSILVSIARCFSICELQTEAELRTQYDKTIGFQKQIEEEQSGQLIINSNWPQNPTIEFKNFTMRYQSDLQPALKNINLKIKEGTKVAFIGRTGSGKSSMIQSLFRMYQSDYQSQLFIGGYNAKLMGLRSLRNSLSIIPQCSFIFRGTIRENIDPFDQYSDEEVWKSLEECKLKECIKQLKQQLNTQIDNDLETFSVGQKQLICLARVLIKNNKIVVLDEATSNIDLETQTFIHEMLKKKFNGKTIITIAHRLETVADYDRVIIMEKGKIAEEGNLFKLLAINQNDKQITSNSIFAEMVKTTNSMKQRIFDIAKSHYLKMKID